MRFIRTNRAACVSSGVVHSGTILEAVLTGIPQGQSRPVPGGVTSEMEEIFRQLDEIMVLENLSDTDVCSASIYLSHLSEDVGSMNEVWRDYFGDHAPNRRCYGVALQLGMRVEAAFVVEVSSHESPPGSMSAVHG